MVMALEIMAQEKMAQKASRGKLFPKVSERRFSKLSTYGGESKVQRVMSPTGHESNDRWTGDEWNDGWSFDEWHDDWSSVGWHEGWEQTYVTSAS